jgi:hypothetical protein
VIAAYQGKLPLIDGDPGDWSAAWYTADKIVDGEGYHAGAADLSAEFKLGWNQDFLLVAAVVRDSKFVQNAKGAQLWQGDSLELLIDTDMTGDYYLDVLNHDDFHLGISPGQLNLVSGNPLEAYIWEPSDKRGVFDRVAIAARLTSEGYLMEVAIPWFMLKVTPAAGQHFGFLFSVSDNDAGNENHQQTVVSFAPERKLYDPTSWKDLTLQQ